MRIEEGVAYEVIDVGGVTVAIGITEESVDTRSAAVDDDNTPVMYEDEDRYITIG
jgi:hypothetical protein